MAMSPPPISAAIPTSSMMIAINDTLRVESAPHAPPTLDYGYVCRAASAESHQLSGYVRFQRAQTS